MYIFYICFLYLIAVQVRPALMSERDFLPLRKLWTLLVYVCHGACGGRRLELVRAPE